MAGSRLLLVVAGYGLMLECEAELDGLLLLSVLGVSLYAQLHDFVVEIVSELAYAAVDVALDRRQHFGLQ